MMIATNPREMDAKNAYFADSIELKMAVPTMFIPAKRNPMKYNLKPFSAMIKNGIADFKVKEKEAPKQVEVDIPDGHYKRRQKKRSLSDIEEQVGE
jgi:hypothetical protein